MKRVSLPMRLFLCGLALGMPLFPHAARAESLPETDGTHIYANGTPLLICEQGEGSTIFLDTNGNGALDAGERSLFAAGIPGAPKDGADLSGFTVYGGGWDGPCSGDAQVTMLGGEVAALYGGGGGRKARIGGNTRIVLLGGTVTGGVYGGGNGSAADVAGSASILIAGGTVLGCVYGGGRGGDYLPGDYADVLGGAGITIAGGTVCGSIYGGACLYGRVGSGATVTLTGGTVHGSVTGNPAYPSRLTRVSGRRQIRLSGAPTVGAVGTRTEGKAAPRVTGIQLAGFTGGRAVIAGPFDYAPGSFASIVLIGSAGLRTGSAVAVPTDGAAPDANPFVLYAGGACLPLRAERGFVAVAS